MDSTIVKQRIRNRQIEWLEMAVVPKDAARMGWYEFVNLWDDVSPKTCFLCMTEPVFTKNEISQLERIEELVTSLADDHSEDSSDPEWLERNEFYDALRDQPNLLQERKTVCRLAGARSQTEVQWRLCGSAQQR